MKRENRAFRLIVTLCMTVILLTTLCLHTVAAEDNGWMASRKDISSEGVLTIPDGVRTVTVHVLDRVCSPTIVTVEIPNSVAVVEAGAFKSAYRLKTVVIDNYEGGLEIEEGAFRSKTEIKYLREKPTEKVTTDISTDIVQTDPEPSTAAPKVPAATAPATVTTTKQTVTTTKKKPAETTTKEETTAEETTTVKVTESTPFSDAKSQLEDVEVWNKLINQTTEEQVAEQQKTGGFAKGASYVAVAVVAVSAIGLSVLKFKK